MCTPEAEGKALFDLTPVEPCFHQGAGRLWHISPKDVRSVPKKCTVPV